MFWTACKVFLTMTLLTGCLYPLIVTGIATWTMPHQAYGSLIYQNEQLKGSELIVQPFTDNRYFWPRPSAANYNPLLSQGSNLAPTSRKLKQIVQERAQKLATLHSTNLQFVPPELVYASGSGLDPHISLKAAHFQVERVSRARRLSPKDKDRLYQLVDQLLESRSGILSAPYLNVFLLNRQLDHQFSSHNKL